MTLLNAMSNLRPNHVVLQMETALTLEILVLPRHMKHMWPLRRHRVGGQVLVFS
jgi:hypothetical protein